MKPRYFITSVIVGAALAAPGFALAQGAGGGSSTGTGPAGSGNDTYSAPTQGAEQNPSVSGSNNTTTHRSHVKKNTKYTKKPMNDTTNMPGADASSDTKGQ